MFAILIAFASGALVTSALFWWWARRAAGVLSAVGDGSAGGNGADAPASAADAVSLSTASAARLQQLAEGLAPAGEASAHPRDLTGHPMFREAVGLLESDAVTLTTCADYATGANWPLSAAAFAALATRADGAQPLPVVIARLQALRPWPMYYALRYLAGLDRPPAPGLVMLRCEDWWGDHPFMPAFLTVFFDSFATRGLPVSFGDALPTATPAQRQTTEDVLKKLDHPAARALLEESLAFRRGAIDREFLQTFGRSVMTSFTVFITLLALFLFGGSSITNFILILLIGITAGTYSSIFVASPLLVDWHRWEDRRHGRTETGRSPRPRRATS